MSMSYDGRGYGTDGNAQRRRTRGGQQRNVRNGQRQGNGSGRDGREGREGHDGRDGFGGAGDLSSRDYGGGRGEAHGGGRADGHGGGRGEAQHVGHGPSYDAERSGSGHELLGAAVEHLEARDISSATKVLMKLAKVDHARGVRNDPKLRDVLSRLYGQLHAQDLHIWPRDLSDIAFALGKLQLVDPVIVELLKRIADVAKYQADKFSPHDMAGIVWGFASLGVRNESLMSVIAAEIVNKIEGFDQRQLSNTAWAFAKCGLWNEQLVSAIASECLAKISTFTAQSLSHISWAMAQWGTRKEDLMSAIAAELQRKTSEFAPAPLAMTAWSFASLQIKNSKLMTAISAEAVNKISQFKTQDVAHLAWAFANLRIQDHHLFNIMAEEIQSNIKGTLPPELANIAWAFSKNNLMHESLMNTIAGEAVTQLSNFKAAEVAMLTWAFAVAGLQNKQLMHEIGTQVAKRIDKFTAPQLSHVAWAFGALSLRHSEFLQSLSAHVHKHLQSFKAQALSNIAWAFAMVTFRDEPLLRRVAPEIARDTIELRPLALARCAWAYRVLAVQCPDLMSAITLEAINKVDDFPTKALVKLIDSVYISSAAKEHSMLEKALSGRLASLSGLLKETWKPYGQAPGISPEEYSAQLANFGCLDCGIVGTPMMLEQLQVKLPSRSFIQRCRAKEWAKCTHDHCSRGNKELTVAEINLSVRDRPLHDWVVRYVGDGAEDQDASPLEPASAAEGRHSAGHWLLAVDLPGRSGRADTTYMVLTEVCERIFNLGVEPDAPDSCGTVQGSLQILSTVLPGISSIGALHQFAIWFPSVGLEFVEQVGVTAEQ